MSEVKQPGTIGEQYENRTSKKLGVLESRDEKCKTLMFRGEDGNSFNVTYSTFKSNWRKYKGDKQIQTSTQVEEEKQEVEEAKKVVKKKSSRISREEMFKVVNATKKIVDSVAEGYENFIIKVTAKGGISFRVSNRGYAEIWVKPALNCFALCMRDNVYEIIPEYLKTDYTNKSFVGTRTLEYVVRGIPTDLVEQVTEEILDCIVEVTNKNVEDEEEEESKEEE